MAPTDIEEICDGGDTAIQWADKIRACFVELEFSGRKGLGAHFVFETVDAHAVRDFFRVPAGVCVDFAEGSKEERQDPRRGFCEDECDVCVCGRGEEFEAAY